MIIVKQSVQTYIEVDLPRPANMPCLCKMYPAKLISTCMLNMVYLNIIPLTK